MNKSISDKKDATLFDIFIFLIISISFVSISLLVLNEFSVFRSIALGLFSALSIFWIINRTGGVSFNVNRNKHLLPVMLLLVLGLFFRSGPYHYIAGGQDEGVYVNMSKYYEKYGKIFFTDELRKTLPGDLRKDYDAANIKTVHGKWRVENKKEGFYLPGVYVKNQQKSEYVFQFYHLHPLWMSIFGTLFGDENRTYSLVFFSLLSLLAFYLLAFEFVGKRSIAFIGAALLAINPLHAFFSKFPVTEVVALSFTTLSFYYLLKYYNLAKKGEYKPLNLVLSSLLITCMFFTRISGFMYIPFFYLILLLAQLYICEQKLKRQISLYVFSVFVLYGVSVWYGLLYSYPYSSDIYEISFARFSRDSWPYVLCLFLVLLVIIYLLIVFISRSKFNKTIKDYLSSLKGAIPYVFLVIFSAGLYKAYQLGFTEKFIGNSNIVRWGGAGTEFKAFAYWSVFVLVEYLSPFLAILFSCILFSQVRRNGSAKILLALFTLLFFVHISLLQWFIPYQYYYARYLLSEVLPFILLYTVIGLDEIKKFKRAAYIALGISAVYMLCFTCTQFKGREMKGLDTGLSELKKYVGSDDILILDKDRLIRTGSEIKTTLRFFYDYNVLTVKAEDRTKFVDYYCSGNNNIYFFSAGYNPAFAEPIKTIDLNVESFDRCAHIPVRVVHHRAQYKLSKISCAQYRSNRAKAQHDNYLYKRDILLLGEMVNFHEDRLWTKSTSGFVDLNFEVGDNKFLVLETFGWNPFKSNLQRLMLRVKVNGKYLTFSKKIRNKYYFTLPKLHKILELEIFCNTFIPKKMGINRDTRELGIDIKSIKLVQQVTE